MDLLCVAVIIVLYRNTTHHNLIRSISDGLLRTILYQSWSEEIRISLTSEMKSKCCRSARSLHSASTAGVSLSDGPWVGGSFSCLFVVDERKHTAPVSPSSPDASDWDPVYGELCDYCCCCFFLYILMNPFMDLKGAPERFIGASLCANVSDQVTELAERKADVRTAVWVLQ